MANTRTQAAATTPTGTAGVFPRSAPAAGRRGLAEAVWWAGCPVRLLATHPVGVIAVGIIALLIVVSGKLWWLFCLFSPIVGVGLCRRYLPSSYATLVGDRMWRYRKRSEVEAHWRELMTGCGLAMKIADVTQVPALARCWWDEHHFLHARPILLVGHTIADVERAAEALRIAVGALQVRVRPDYGWIGCDIVFIFHNPLAETIPTPLPVTTSRAIVPDSVWMGRREDGRPWQHPLRGSTLTAGSTGAGKGSVLWTLLAGIAPAVCGGSIHLYGIDLKGGMELGLAPSLFTRYATTPDQAVALLETAANECQARTASLAGITRTHIPTTEAPLVIMIIDELASLTAYSPDRDLTKRAHKALATVLATGRAPGFHVYAFAQDPRKETIPMRHLFTQTIALRLREREETTMVLGETALTAGASCHRIPIDTPGTGYIIDPDGRPIRVRAGYLADAEIRTLAHRFPAPSQHAATVEHNAVELPETKPRRRTRLPVAPTPGQETTP